MDTPRAKSALKGQRFSQIEWLDEIDSTNSELMDRARDGAVEQVLGSNYQTAGKGRRGRHWQAETGSAILMSILVRPDMAPDHLHLLTAALGVAATDAIESVLGCRAREQVGLKWPNDIVDARGQKLAGMLSESVISAGPRNEGSVDAVVLGIGMNVTSAPSPEATCLSALIETDSNGAATAGVDRSEVVVAILSGFANELSLIEAKSESDLMRRYREACSTIGQRVRVSTPHGDTIGTAIGVDDAGHLMVEPGLGEPGVVEPGGVVQPPRSEPLTFAVADVHHVRPA